MTPQARSAVLRMPAVRVDAAVSKINEFDARRILRALKRRARYRYVAPEVVVETDGYRIASPCCSRNVDADGGGIDIARLVCEGQPARWLLYSRNHPEQVWELRAEGRLHALLDLLCADPGRIFWK